MSEIFNLKRFGRVLHYDLQRCSIVNFRVGEGNMGLNMLGMILLPLMMGLAFKWMGEPQSLITRWFVVYFAMLLTALMVPEVLYGRINQNRGIHYAMLPATKLEKYLSMLLMTLVICPVMVFCGIVVVDTLLTFLPLHLFKDYLWQLGNPLWPMGIDIDMPAWFHIYRAFTLVFGFVLVGMGFVLGNTLFRKNKTVLTLCCFLGMGFLTTLVLTFIRMMRVSSFSVTSSYGVGYVTGTLFGWVFHLGVLLQLALIVFFTWLSWKKIKNMGY